MVNAINELKKIKSELVTTANIKNIVCKAPREQYEPLGVEDLTIQNASIRQIEILNEMFNLKSSGGYKN